MRHSLSVQHWLPLLCAAIVAACGAKSEQQLIESARAYLAKHETPAAVVELKQALQVNADSAEARYLLGKTFLENGDPAAAEVELRKAQRLGMADVALLPELARATMLLAEPWRVTEDFAAVTLSDATANADLKTTVAAAYAQQGDLKMAAEAVALALQSDPTHPPAVMVQARMKAGAGDVEGALGLLDTVLARDPGNEHAGVAKGQLLWLGKQDADAALAVLRQVLAAQPSSVAAQAEIVTILFRQRKLEESRQQFDALKQTAPNHPHTHYFDAQFAYIDKRYRESRERTDALLKAVPNHYRALELAAAAEYHLGSDAQTQAFAERALKVAPSLTLARQILAQSYLRAGQPAKAIDALRPLLAGEHADAESLAIAGSAYLELGDSGKADAAFKAASSLAPENLKVRTEAALAMVHDGRAQIALENLESIAAADRGPRADLALISTRISQRDFRGALRAIDNLEVKLTGRPLPHQLRGQVLISLRDADGARRSFEAALASDAKYFPAVAALASLEVVTGKAGLARDRVAAYSKSVPNDARALILLAEIADAAGASPDEVLAHLRAAVQADQTDAGAHKALIARHLRLGDRPSALTAAQSAAAVLQNDASIIEALAQAQLLAGDSMQAIATFRDLAALRPNEARVVMQLAEAQLAANDLDGAARSLDSAVELEPDMGAARRGQAMLALRDKRPLDAIAIARDMQKRDINGALGYSIEGDIEVQRKNWGAAAKAYRAALQRSQASEVAVKLHSVLSVAEKITEAERVATEFQKKRPNDPVFRFYLGDVATQRQDYATAEQHYRAVLQTQPRNAQAFNNIAWLMLERSKPGALGMAERADELMPNRAPILDTLAAAQAAEGQLSHAIETQRRAIAASPQDANLKLGLARYLIKAGDQDEARKHLRELARLGARFHHHAEVRTLLNSR